MTVSQCLRMRARLVDLRNLWQTSQNSFSDSITMYSFLNSRERVLELTLQSFFLVSRLVGTAVEGARAALSRGVGRICALCLLR